MMAPISREAESQDRIGRELMAWAVTVGLPYGSPAGLPCSSEPDSDTCRWPGVPKAQGSFLPQVEDQGSKTLQYEVSGQHIFPCSPRPLSLGYK